MNKRQHEILELLRWNTKATGERLRRAIGRNQEIEYGRNLFHQDTAELQLMGFIMREQRGHGWAYFLSHEGVAYVDSLA